MRAGQEVLGDLREALSMEWMIANGLGGSASGTATGFPARRTQGYLVAASPHGRLTTLLVACEERLMVGTDTWELATRVLPDGTARPGGHQWIESFAHEPWPTWRFRAGAIVLEKTLFTVFEHNAVAIVYRHVEGPAARLAVTPLVTCREPRAESAGEPATPAVQAIPGRVRVEVETARTVTLWHDGAFMPARAQRALHYPEERRSGFGADETVGVPGYVETELRPGRILHVIVSAEEDLFRALAREDRLGAPPPKTLAGCVEAIAEGERRRVARWRGLAREGAETTARQAHAAHRGTPDGAEVSAARARDPWTTALADAVLSGLVRRPLRTSLVATLPGAEERPADALRAVPALLALRAFDVAREVLRGYVEYLNEGLLPESFDPDDGTPRYGDPTPSLWFVLAAERYARRSEDAEFTRETLYPAVEAIMHFYRSGTRHGIRVDEDDLLAAGEGDAIAKRADVNALWHHAQLATGKLARALGRKEHAAFFLAWGRNHHERCNEVLWDEAEGCMHRALRRRGPEPGLDLSQLLAVGLSPPLLDPDRAGALVSVFERERFTPFGLRPAPRASRLETVWIGPFLTAYVRAHDRSPEAQARCMEWLDVLREACGERAGLPEVFAEVTGERLPRRAGSGISILATAELLRFWIEELDVVGATQPA